MMEHHLDVKAETIERRLIDGPTVFEVLVEGSEGNIYESWILYRREYDANRRRDQINAAMFAATCGFCRVPADFIEYVDELLGSQDIDVIAWCSDACREESLIEDAQLRRAGL